MSVTEESCAPYSSGSSPQPQEGDSPSRHPDSSSAAKDEDFPDPEIEDQELRTITRQMIATALGSPLPSSTAATVPDQRKTGEPGNQVSADSSPLIGQSSVDREDFEVLVASSSGDDWQPI